MLEPAKKATTGRSRQKGPAKVIVKKKKGKHLKGQKRHKKNNSISLLNS